MKKRWGGLNLPTDPMGPHRVTVEGAHVAT